MQTRPPRPPFPIFNCLHMCAPHFAHCDCCPWNDHVNACSSYVSPPPSLTFWPEVLAVAAIVLKCDSNEYGKHVVRPQVEAANGFGVQLPRVHQPGGIQQSSANMCDCGEGSSGPIVCGWCIVRRCKLDLE